MHCQVTPCQLTQFKANSHSFKLAADCRDCVRDTPRLQTQNTQTVSCQGRCLSASGELKQSAPNSQTPKECKCNQYTPRSTARPTQTPRIPIPTDRAPGPKTPKHPRVSQTLRDSQKPLSDSRTAVPESNTSEPTSVPRHYTTQNCILA